MCRLSKLHYPECIRHTGCRRDGCMLKVAPVKFEQNPRWPCESSILKCTTRHNRPVFAFGFDMILISLKLLSLCLSILCARSSIVPYKELVGRQFKNRCTAKNTLAV